MGTDGGRGLATQVMVADQPCECNIARVLEPSEVNTKTNIHPQR
jgi:hypothetical protein